MNKTIDVHMAIAIKNVPVLKGAEAIRFDANAKVAIAKKSTVKFTKQIQIASNILKKAKI